MCLKLNASKSRENLNSGDFNTILYKEVGTEVHVTMHSDNGNTVKCRKRFFMLIFASSAQLQMLDTEQLFTYLLACVETNIIYYFAIFLDEIYK